MGQKNINEPYYYSDRLQQKLNKLRLAPTAGIEALSDYSNYTLSRPSVFVKDVKEIWEHDYDTPEISFTQYAFSANQYDLHKILSEFSIQKPRYWDADFQLKYLLSAGDYFRNEGMADKALDFYLQAGDYERMLSLDLSPLILEDIGGVSFREIALFIAQNCPYSIKKRYVLSMLQVAWALLTEGLHPEFDILMKELDEMLEESVSEEAKLLRGEWLLLSSWRCLPRLDEMTKLLMEATSLFGGTFSRVIMPSAPWCFGEYSQLAVFHIKSGDADREADALEKYISLYSKLTNGHGNGADVLLRAELAHYRGDLNEGEILAYKADFLAESSRQSIIQLGAALHLAEIAVEKSDAVGWQRAIDSMECAASYSEQNNFVLRSAMDMLRSLLLNELCHQKRIKDWLKNGKNEGRLLPVMQKNALFVRLDYFMHEGEFTRLCGVAEGRLESLGSTEILTDALLSLLAAVGHMSLGNTSRAETLLDHAAKIALPDGFIYLFAAYDWILQGLPKKLIEEQHPQQLINFLNIRERFLSGFSKLHQDIIAEELPESLTSREREVALFAASGLHNNEIAEKIFVSENTVRAHMRTIFKKLDIDRRAKLAEKLK